MAQHGVYLTPPLTAFFHFQFQLAAAHRWSRWSHQLSHISTLFFGAVIDDVWRLIVAHCIIVVAHTVCWWLVSLMSWKISDNWRKEQQHRSTNGRTNSKEQQLPRGHMLISPPRHISHRLSVKAKLKENADLLHFNLIISAQERDSLVMKCSKG